MKSVFADSFYYLAFVSEQDAAHQRAIEFSQQYTGRTVTTTWVLTEVGDALCAPGQRASFLALLETLRDNPTLTIIPPSAELFDQGVELFRQRPDKRWSLTDCISFVVMEDAEITEALTGDHHFEQAGFNALLK